MFYYECDFVLKTPDQTKDWIESMVKRETYKLGELNYIFCLDNYLLDINKRFLKHDTLTDVIGFSYSEKNFLSGDIYISVERVKDNALFYMVPFTEELHRVMIHGLLHFMGYKDGTAAEKAVMQAKEEECLSFLYN